MVTFQVNDMTCGHCIGTITKAVRSVDQGAEVQVDLATHRVQIESTEADAHALCDAIAEAGYSPVRVADAAAVPAAAARRAGCCCR